MFRLLVVSGLSGSGKSVALHMLEDLGWFCTDNIPAGLVRDLVTHALQRGEQGYDRVAVGLDARNRPDELARIPELVRELRASGLRCEIVYLHAEQSVLLRRFAETRRRHPLSREGMSLADALAAEGTLLHPLVDGADLVIDTSMMSVHALRELVRQRLQGGREARLAILFQSFGFKAGIPGDADFVFDARTLPNPYWEPELKPLTGLDAPVQRFLGEAPAVAQMIDDIAGFLERRIPDYERNNRGYLTVAIGCTGGQHRSVYIAEQLASRFGARHPQVMVRHTALPSPA